MSGYKAEFTKRLVDQLPELVGQFRDDEIRQYARNGDIDGVLARARELHALMPPRNELLQRALAGEPRGAVTDSMRAGRVVTHIETHRQLIDAL